MTYIVCHGTSCVIPTFEYRKLNAIWQENRGHWASREIRWDVGPEGAKSKLKFFIAYTRDKGLRATGEEHVTLTLESVIHQ